MATETFEPIRRARSRESVAILAQAICPELQSYPFVMTKALVTVRNGASVTYIHEAALAAAWIQQLGAASLPTPSRPTTSLPTTKLPTTSLPVASMPTISMLPTTRLPTTGLHTTGLPTTSLPTTSLPTKCLPTTSLPTTSLPTKCLPTTSPPTASLTATSMPTTTTGLPTTSLPTTSLPTDLKELESDIEHRLEIVEKAIRLQLTLGATHLQQVEMAPESFGLSAAARGPVRTLRRGRNRALHSSLVTGDFMNKGTDEDHSTPRDGALMDEVEPAAPELFVGNAVWVWSCSAQSWCPGRVKTATDHSLVLEYTLPDNTLHVKERPQRDEEVRARHSAVDD